MNYPKDLSKSKTSSIENRLKNCKMTLPEFNDKIGYLK